MIAIIDYGVGNLKSVEKAFEYMGSKAVVTSERDVILNADGVVLPGVGAYADAMESLRNAGMVEVVEKVVSDNRPFLGICLGMQLLFDYSEEGGDRVPGLGIFKGSIRQLPLDMGLKVPHMGWNKLQIQGEQPLFGNLTLPPYVYFVHSYYLTAEDRSMVAGRAFYGIEFDVAVTKGKVFATQFHPEKSGEVGLEILRNFAGMVEER